MVDFTKRIHIETGLTRKSLLHNIPSALKGVDKMPSGKELEQLPMTNTHLEWERIEALLKKKVSAALSMKFDRRPSKAGEQKRNNPG